MTDKKTCTKCGLEKPLSEYHNDSSRKLGVYPSCKQCVLSRLRADYKRNKPKYDARTRNWMTNNAERRREWFREYMKSYKTTPQGQRSARGRDYRRKATKRGSDSGCWFAREEYAELVVSDPCARCGRRPVEVDHIEAISRSLDDSWSNLAPLCRSCNASKGTKPLLFWMLEVMS